MFDLNVLGIFFSEVNIFHYRTQKWNLQIYKLKTLLVLNVNFGFQQTDVITSFIHFIENHFSFALQLWTHRPASVPLRAGVVFLSNKLSGASYSLYWDYFL